MSTKRAAPGLPVETFLIADLKPHPRNYRQHPDDQLEHLAESIREHGFYRNIVVARDSTILAGHGVVLAAAKMGKTEVPGVRLDLAPDSPRALKVWAGMPEFENEAEYYKLVISFDCEADRDRLVQETGIRVRKTEGKTSITRWPWRDDVDGASVRFKSKT